ncbi:alpha/beta hydrolase family protein [Paenimyroides baculatum]|uniref:Alpha/beta hydrolase n=1 Tax=Paenimyroides baculatum TaxID=2608000 RepID=A0A5M6CNE6_9FLAO|nr:alpha/beta fold hydrolase [Paenimyroides baculatum]KAA5535910.1 alpha/beta hydrolase [Paenimyroides baculatum]
MKNFILFFALLFSFSSFAQIEGTWNGAIEIPNQKLPFVLHITKENGQYKATSDSPDQGVYGIELQEIRFENNKLYLKDARMYMTYEGDLTNGNTINGTFKQGGQSFKLNFTKGEFKRNRPQEPQPPFSYKTEDVTFENKEAKIKLAGTLTMPNGKGKFPAVVLVTGSGAQDRNEEILGHKSFLVIADHLTKNGYAVLRYDDRGVAASEGDFESATTYNFANDAKSAVDFLKNIKEIDSKKIGILGHSEGGMIAQIIAAERKDLPFIISLAGPGISIDELMLVQKYEIEKASGLSNEVLEANQKLFRKIYEIIKKNPSNDIANKEIKSFLKSDPTYKELSDKQINELASITESNWFATFIRYNPENNLKKINAKALILNGEKDVQVTAKENLEGWIKDLSHNKKATIKSYPNLNHLFQSAKTGMPNEYGEIETTIEPFVLEDITKWLNENVK